MSVLEKNQEEKTKSEEVNDKIIQNKIPESAFNLNLEEDKELLEHLILNSIDLVHANHSIVTANQQSATKKLNKTNEIFEFKKNLQVFNFFLLNYYLIFKKFLFFFRKFLLKFQKVY